METLNKDCLAHITTFILLEDAYALGFASRHLAKVIFAGGTLAEAQRLSYFLTRIYSEMRLVPSKEHDRRLLFSLGLLRETYCPRKTVEDLFRITTLKIKRGKTLSPSISLLTQLTTLSIKGIKMTELPWALRKLRWLISLSFVSCGLQRITSSGKDRMVFPNLRQLNLSKNNLENLRGLAAPFVAVVILKGNCLQILSGESIYNRGFLTTVDFSGNFLFARELSPVFMNPFLISLALNDIGSCDLTGISSLKKLKYLSAKNNSIGDISDLIFPESLQEINLSRNRIKEVPKGLLVLIHLRKLDLSYNRIERIADHPTTLSSLESLNLSYNSLKEMSWRFCCPALEQIDLSHNSLEKIPDWIITPCLRLLKFNDNKVRELPPRGKLETIEACGNPIQKIPKRLILRKNPLRLWLTNWKRRIPVEDGVYMVWNLTFSKRMLVFVVPKEEENEWD